MSGDLERRDAGAEWVGLLPAVGELAGKIAGTDFVPKAYRGNVAAVAACILTGHELGMGPMTSLRGINVIQGRVSMSSQMLGARVYAAGHSLEWGTSSDTEATVTLTRGDGLGAATVTFTMDMARRGGLTRNETYKAFPEAMLRARALSSVVAMAAPDVALGLEAAQPETPAKAAAKTMQLAVRAPVKVEAPAVEAAPVPPKASPGQVRHIMALLGKGLSRDDRLTKLGGIIGRDLDTMNALTFAEASLIIEALTDEQS
jgi:hypothetical protein